MIDSVRKMAHQQEGCNIDKMNFTLQRIIKLNRLKIASNFANLFLNARISGNSSLMNNLV
jgi:hypothetical protein